MASCSSDTVDPTNELDCTGESATYTSEVKGIMDGSCALPICHSAGTRAAGINLSTYEDVKRESIRSRFMGSIRRESGFEDMPQGAPKLSDATINTLACWIENGHLE